MHRITFLLALLLATAPPLTAPDAEWQAPKKFTVQVVTSKGDFLVQVQRAWAPRGADRFYELVRSGYFDDSRFFRVREGFIVQFGIAGQPQRAQQWRDRSFPDDTVIQTNTRGHVAFAMTGPDTRTTQIYINLADNSRLDAGGFAPFAQVVRGMDVVDQLYAGYGEDAGGGMRGGKQDSLFASGNRYLDQAFPNLDRLIRATVLVGDDQ